MKISFGTRIDPADIGGINGYGRATKGMLSSLERLGYQVEPNDATADVEIWFDQPQHWKFSPNTYKIGYHPWESTELLPGWAEIMNQCDEIWTPSPLIADWYRFYGGITKPVYVYKHGIDDMWTPVKRVPEQKIKFLHIGAEATRKGGWDAVRQFRKAFQNVPDVSLTLKMVNSSWNSVPSLGKVKYINEKYDLPDLIDLYYSHDVFVYPSCGEGFGLTPAQALATGMPTITVPEWAPYSDYLDPNLSVSAKLVKSSWQEIHPGNMFQPDLDELVDRFRYAYDNYDQVRDFACSNANEFRAEYNWDTITRPVFSDLENRLKR